MPQSKSEQSAPVPAPTASPPAHRHVVAAVIERDAHLLICQRPLGKNHGGLWEFPGGKIDIGETAETAIARELAEELGVITVQVGDSLLSVHDQRSGYEIHFIPAVIEGEPMALEHSAIGWCPRDHLLSYELAPSDRIFATHFLSIPS
jgi:mutator protein MutT